MRLSNLFPQPAPVAWRVSHLVAFAEVPLEKNPFMRSFEIQRLRYLDREGANVVIHRYDGAVEVHHDHRLGLPPGWTKIDPAFSHMDVQIEEPADLSDAVCRVDEVENRIEATITDSTGADLTFRLHFDTASESGPIFIPCPPCTNPSQMRFLTVNRFRLVDARTAELTITHNGQTLNPSRLVPTAPKHRLSARSGSELLCASLCSPDIQSDTISSPQNGDRTAPVSISARNHAGHFTLQLDSPAAGSGPARVMTRLGQVATANWTLETHHTTPKNNVGSAATTFRLSDITQDWRPPGFSTTKHALRAARRYRRRDESWCYDYTATPSSLTSRWSN